MDSLFAPDPTMKLSKAESSNLLQNSIKTGLAASVGLFGMEGNAATISESDLNETTGKINIFNANNIFPANPPDPKGVSTPAQPGESTSKVVERMSQKEFMKVAELDPDLIRCFGMINIHCCALI